MMEDGSELVKNGLKIGIFYIFSLIISTWSLGKVRGKREK